MGDEHTSPAAPGSVLAGLRKAREKALSALTIDLQVPRLDPPVYVRYRPIQQRELEAANKRGAELAQAKDPDAYVTANAVVLTNACVGIFGTVDGKPDGDPASWPTFDSKLADLLGLPPEASGVELVRALYLTDGDVITTADALNGWSAPAVRKLDEDIAGN